MVVADLLVIHKGTVWADLGAEKGWDIGFVRALIAGLQAFLDGGDHVGADIAGIGPWISQHLMIFIQALHDV